MACFCNSGVTPMLCILQVKKFVPNLRILNAKPIETSSKKDKSPIKANFSNKDDMYDHAAAEIGTKKKDKKKQSKQQLREPEEHDVTASTPSKSEVLDGKGRKKVAMEHADNSKLKSKDDKSSANDTGRKDKKENKSEVLDGNGRKTENAAMEHTDNSKLKRKHDKSSANDTGREDKKEAKRKKFVDEEDADETDNTEVSFADLVFSKVDNSEPMPDDKTQEADGKYDGMVIDYTKKRKKSKGVVTITDISTLKKLSSVPEVGTVGLGLRMG
jgi:hypothetical protein